MTTPRRYYARSADGSLIVGYDERAAAAAQALDYGEGAFLIDTGAQAYHPMLEWVAGGALAYLGFGGWDTGRFEPGRDLIEGIKKGHVAIAHAFLAKGASANAADVHGGSALHWAVARGRPEIVRLLLDHGADPAYRDATGKSALDLARERGNRELIAALEKLGPEQS
jgi:hypothetical protein